MPVQKSRGKGQQEFPWPCLVHSVTEQTVLTHLQLGRHGCEVARDRAVSKTSPSLRRRAVWSSGGKQPCIQPMEAGRAREQPRGSEGRVWRRLWLKEARNGLSDQEGIWGASRVAQRWRIHLLMQMTQVRSPVREDPTCHRAAKPVRHDWACALEPSSPRSRSPGTPESMLSNKRSHRNEKPPHGS